MRAEVSLRDAIDKMSHATPEEWEAVRADLQYELTHAEARLGVLTALQRYLERRLAAVQEPAA